MYVKYKTLVTNVKVRTFLIDCGNPPAVADGSVTSTGTTYLETATYTCDVGHTRSGAETIQCLATPAWETAPTCDINGMYITFCGSHEVGGGDNTLFSHACVGNGTNVCYKR